jgi:hypothetical protein
MKKRGQTDLQIRGLPTALRDKVRQRAKRKGQTMSHYLIDLLEREHAKPSLDEWLDEVRRWKPIPVRPGGISPAQAIREAREERAEHLANVFKENARRMRR